MVKVIVNNEDEKELMVRFLEHLHEIGIYNVEEEDNKYSLENNIESELSSEEYEFLNNGIFFANVEIDKKEPQLFTEHHIIKGTCTICNSPTEGTIDGTDVGYSEYIEMIKDSSSWKCETCYFKEDE